MASMTDTVLPFFDFSPAVRDALAAGRAVVALESTLISHGLPWPENKTVGAEIEEIVRSHGATPATIAIMNGRVKIGLTDEELEALASPESKTLMIVISIELATQAQAVKVSRRDIAFVLARGVIGATTVSATALLAAKAGIRIFATGGIGGVHRDGENSLDISADLTELGRTPICVVSAGIKSILDIGRTLEYLETQGVTVVGYGTDEYPSFFTRTSGFQSPCRLDTPQECAKLVYYNHQLALNSGMLISVPIPEDAAADGDAVESATQIALKECDEQKIVGRDITPFILKRVAVLTEGASLKANLALIKNNASIAAQIAAQLAAMTPQQYRKRGF